MTEDPMEAQIADALRAIGIEFGRDRDCSSPANLDFYVPSLDVHIEVKRMHTPRVSEQMGRVENVIVAQGPLAVAWLARLIKG